MKRRSQSRDCLKTACAMALAVVLFVLSPLPVSAQYSPGVGHGQLVVSGEFLRGSWSKPFLSINNRMLRELFPGRFPGIRNLEFGLDLLSSPGEVNSLPYDKRLFLDFQPSIMEDATQRLFLEFHAQRKFRELLNGRSDGAIGLGYRRIINESLLTGLNAFIDINRPEDGSRAVWGWGFETAYAPVASGGVDLSFNQYGNPFEISRLREQLSHIDTMGWDAEIGYTRPAFLNKFNLRLKFDGYSLNSLGRHEKGIGGGVDMSSHDRQSTLSLEYSRQITAGKYYTVLAAIAVPFEPELIVRGKSPFTFPVFESVRPREQLARGWLARRVPRHLVGLNLWQ